MHGAVWSKPRWRPDSRIPVISREPFADSSESARHSSNLKDIDPSHHLATMPLIGVNRPIADSETRLLGATNPTLAGSCEIAQRRCTIRFKAVSILAENGHGNRRDLSKNDAMDRTAMTHVSGGRLPQVMVDLIQNVDDHTHTDPSGPTQVFQQILQQMSGPQ